MSSSRARRATASEARPETIATGIPAPCSILMAAPVLRVEGLGLDTAV